VLGQIKAEGYVRAIEWFSDSSKVIVATPRRIACYNVYTYEELWTIENESETEGAKPETTSAWSKLQLVADLYLVFEDKQGLLQVYDITYKKVRAKTESIAHTSV
jgi:hypothetical protein